MFAYSRCAQNKQWAILVHAKCILRKLISKINFQQYKILAVICQSHNFHFIYLNSLSLRINIFSTWKYHINMTLSNRLWFIVFGRSRCLCIADNIIAGGVVVALRLIHILLNHSIYVFVNWRWLLQFIVWIRLHDFGNFCFEKSPVWNESVFIWKSTKDRLVIFLLACEIVFLINTNIIVVHKAHKHKQSGIAYYQLI